MFLIFYFCQGKLKFYIQQLRQKHLFFATNSNFLILLSVQPVAELKEFKPRFKSAKTRFKLSAGLNLETFDTIFNGTNHI